ncbi:M20 metallopeptidase family protein [Streptomyces sp. SDT5-1]|uniref:M20 metallopeptidase family protein n=1 Tax=Streptomyces sp. SDT5-1 TaxID=3406418 RepID=UPI003FD2CD99
MTATASTDSVSDLTSDLVEFRRDLHRHPELGLQLPRTQAAVLDALKGLPLEITTGRSLSSVTAVLRGGRPGPAVLLRGDMDALPITELSGETFASETEGVMHACGHDMHVAALVGAARLLCARREQLAGDVVFMFQPGEEGYAGAALMIEEGVLEAAGHTVSAAYGLHVFSGAVQHGVFSSRPGPLMASANFLSVRVVGAGGHGSRPQDALDPIPAACEMVLALQSLTTRRFDIFDPVVITVGEFHAGTQRNIIPDSAWFDATVRAYSPDTVKKIAELAVPLCEGIASAHGLRAEVEFGGVGYPVTHNDPAEHDLAERTARELFGEHRFAHLTHPQTGAEDFACVLEKVPGAFVFLGAGYEDPERETGYNHSPRAAYDDSLLTDAATYLAELATRKLASLAS